MFSFPDSSVGKESICNAGGPSLIPEYGRSAGEGIRPPTPVFLGFLCGSAGKESTCNVGDLDSTPVLGRSSGEGKGYHSSIRAWRIPQTVQSMELQRVGLNWETFTFTSVSDWVKNYSLRKLLDCLLLIMTTSEWNGNQRSNTNQSLRNPKWWAETGGGRQLLLVWW